MLVTVTGISTRTRVLRRVGLDVSISTCETLYSAGTCTASNTLV
jgi:hypothetical protein